VITVYRGALRDGDGFPVLERARWVPAAPDSPDAVALPASLGVAPDSRWKFHGVSDSLAALPVLVQQADMFGTVTDFGGLPSRVDLYGLGLLPGLRPVSLQDWLVGYEDYRQRTDPVGMPAMGQQGSALPALYVQP
jgi:hypothetical protein